MSASEKLEQLDEQFKASTNQRAQADYLYRMAVALPEIIAVVEAAEVYAPVIWRRDADDGHTKNGIELRRRLVALDETLA